MLWKGRLKFKQYIPLKKSRISPFLFKMLHQRRINASGTVRKNRKNYPNLSGQLERDSCCYMGDSLQGRSFGSPKFCKRKFSFLYGFCHFPLYFYYWNTPWIWSSYKCHGLFLAIKSSIFGATVVTRLPRLWHFFYFWCSWLL